VCHSSAETRPSFTLRNCLEKAELIEQGDLFYLKFTFDTHGKLMLDSVSIANKGKRIIVHCFFTESRWLAVPLIQGRISDGVLIVNPDASLQECKDIVEGLNNMTGAIEETSLFKKSKEKKK
jgi:hypothetical protein